MAIIEWLGLMTVTGLIILVIAGVWVLTETSDFIINEKKDWLGGVIIAIVFIFGVIWAIFVDFYNAPNTFGYEKIIVVAEDAESEP